MRGCEEARTALVRARGLAAGAGWGASVSDAAFWAGQTETTLRCLLHAAALDGRRAVEVYRWSLHPGLARDAVTVLTHHPDAADGWADALDAAVGADPRTRDSIWLGVRQALSSLADPRVLAAVDPPPGRGFDPEAFLADAGTLYLLAPATTSASSGPLVAAFVEDITETARRLAATSPGARLDPPLLLALDEIANLTPLPSLPALMAEGGGSGITTMAVLQSLAQARHRWGEHAADAIWDAATVKVVLGGLSQRRDLDDVTRLAGQIDEPTPTHTRGRRGDRTLSTSLRQVPVLPPNVLRTLPFGTAVLLLRHTPPAVLTLQPWTARPDAPQLRRDRTGVEEQIRRRAREGPARCGWAARRGAVPARRRRPRPRRRRRRHRPRLHPHRTRGHGRRPGGVRARPGPGPGLDRPDPHRLPRPAHTVDRRRHGPGILVHPRPRGPTTATAAPAACSSSTPPSGAPPTAPAGTPTSTTTAPPTATTPASTPPPPAATSAPGWTASAASAPTTPTGPSSSSSLISTPSSSPTTPAKPGYPATRAFPTSPGRSWPRSPTASPAGPSPPTQLLRPPPRTRRPPHRTTFAHRRTPPTPALGASLDPGSRGR